MNPQVLTVLTFEPRPLNDNHGYWSRPKTSRPFFMGKSTINGLCSIAMLNYQRVIALNILCNQTIAISTGRIVLFGVHQPSVQRGIFPATVGPSDCDLASVEQLYWMQSATMGHNGKQ